ncbi:hypothetical protein ACP4OV_031857 [Aristida adscensionis]
MDHCLGLGMPFQTQSVDTISPRAPYAPVWNGEGHGQWLGQALEPMSRVDEEGRKEDRKRKGKEVIVEDEEYGSSRGKRVLMSMRRPELLPLFPAPPEPRQEHYYAANTQGIRMPYDWNNMPLKEERDFMQNSLLPNQSFHQEGSSQGGTKPRRYLPKDKSAALEEIFKIHPAPIPEERKGIAQMLGIDRSQVDVWFHNRRNRDKIMQVQLENERLQKRITELEKELKFYKNYHSICTTSTKEPFYLLHQALQLHNLMPAHGSSRDWSNKPRRAPCVGTSSGVGAGPSTVLPSPPPSSSTWFATPRHQYPYTR